MHVTYKSVFLLSAVLLGCGGANAQGRQQAKMAELHKRAAFDLSCPVTSVQSVELSHDTYGVTGCEKKATYVYVLKNPRFPGEGGNWMLNSDSTPAK
jgi:hypothetical protein